MSIFKKIMFPMGPWRQTFATLIVNLMSVHLGVIIGDCMTNNRYELKLFMFKNMKEIQPPPICESRLEYDRKVEREYLRDGYVGFFEAVNCTMNNTKPILSEYNHKYIRDEGVYFAEWMQRIFVFCIGAVMPLAVYIGQRFGIKKALFVSAILFVIASLPFDAVNISREIPSIGAAMVFGVACAFNLCNVLLYVDGISSSNRRGPHLLIQLLLIVTGLYFNTVKHDQAKTFMPIIFNPLVPVLFLIGLQILPESPMWLAEKDKFSAAKQAYDWFQIYEKPSTKLEAVTLDEKSTNIDIINNTSPESLIVLFEMIEALKAAVLVMIIYNARWITDWCSLIRIVNEKVDHWISDLGWIILITILICLPFIVAIMLWILCRMESRQWTLQENRQHVILACISQIMLLSVDGLMCSFKEMSIIHFRELTFFQNQLYVLLVVFPGIIAVVLIPKNVTIGVYVFLMVSSWTINWILAETWWWLKLTTDVNYWSFGYIALFLFLWAYVYFFFTDPEESEKPKESNNCNKKRLLEAEETVVCSTTVPNENILSDSKGTIPCIKDLESR